MVSPPATHAPRPPTPPRPPARDGPTIYECIVELEELSYIVGPSLAGGLGGVGGRGRTCGQGCMCGQGRTGTPGYSPAQHAASSACLTAGSTLSSTFTAAAFR